MERLLQKCKEFLEVPDFEERATLWLEIVLVALGLVIGLSASAHLDNLGDVIFRIGFGGIIIVVFGKLALNQLGVDALQGSDRQEGGGR